MISDLPERVEVALLLRLEVAVERPPRHPRGGRDLSDRRLVVAELGNGGDDAGREAIALVLYDEVAWKAVAAGGKARKRRRFLPLGLAIGHSRTIARGSHVSRVLKSPAYGESTKSARSGSSSSTTMGSPAVRC